VRGDFDAAAGHHPVLGRSGDDEHWRARGRPWLAEDVWRLPLGTGYGAWLSWILPGGLEQFYQELRWPGWEREPTALAPGQGIAVYPFLWSAEAHRDLAATSRRPVPMRELLGLNGEFYSQLGGDDPGFMGRIP
jgi:hypothetical protein